MMGLYDRTAELFQAALRRWIAGDVTVDAIVTLPRVAQDYSGSVVRFYQVSYHTSDCSAKVQLVTKDSSVYERQILSLLDTQAHSNVPLTYSLDMHTRELQLLCQENAGERTQLSDSHIATVAQASATNHTINANAPYLPWMRRLTSATFFTWWQPVWDQACANTSFIHEFELYIQPIEQAAQRFATIIDRFWQDNLCVTVLHTDLSPWHVLIRDDQPYIIDWEQTRYGPLYLNLVNFFTLRTVSLYYEAARNAGFAVTYKAFMEKFHAAWAFVGLKYMVPPLLAWKDEPQESRQQLHALLPRAIATHAPVE